MDFERERGITIKSHAIQMSTQRRRIHPEFIDTPDTLISHTKFLGLLRPEGALLIVDAAQSIQAQTISNLYLALENDLEIIPILIKWIYQVRTGRSKRRYC
jgi:GTP-binding protein LepA